MSKKYLKNLGVGGTFLSRSGNSSHKERDRFHYIKIKNFYMTKTFDKVETLMAL